jgi:hypothetical protein
MSAKAVEHRAHATSMPGSMRSFYRERKISMRNLFASWVGLLSFFVLVWLAFNPISAGATEYAPYLHDWQMLTRIGQHVNSGVGQPFDSRDDFVLLLPFEYGFDREGRCVEYTERISWEQAFWSVYVVEHDLMHPNAELFEDGSCIQVP